MPRSIEGHVYYTVPEAAERLAIGRATLYRWLSNGIPGAGVRHDFRLNPFREAGTGRHYIPEDVIIHMNNNRLVRVGIADAERSDDTETLAIQLPYHPDILRAARQFRALLDDTRFTPEELLRLTSRQFEELVAELWHRFGYDVELTKRTRDGGRDVIAVRQAEAHVRFLIECKRYAPSRKVGVALVRSLYGVKTHERATKAILATTSAFTEAAGHFFEVHRWELEPRDYDGVVEWVRIARTSPSKSRSVLWTPGTA